MKKTFTKQNALLGIGVLSLCALAVVSPAKTVKAEGDTITVTDVRGEVEIPADPQSVVDLSGNSDMLSILGYQVVGTANSDAYDYTVFPPYLEDVLSGAKILGYCMQDTMDVENILDLNPDLIIISTVQEKMYDQLKTLAPTVMIELAQTDWEEDFDTFAKIFDKEDVAQEWLADYHEKAAQVGEEIKEKYGEDTSYLAFLASGGQLYVFANAGFGSILYTDFGLAKPAGLPDQDIMSLPVITYEGLASIEADYIFVLGTEADMADLEANAVWQMLPAVKDGKVVSLPADPYFNAGYSCIGRSNLLDEIPEMLEKIDE